jgi:hypothetical protein
VVLVLVLPPHADGARTGDSTPATPVWQDAPVMQAGRCLFFCVPDTNERFACQRDSGV